MVLCGLPLTTRVPPPVPRASRKNAFGELGTLDATKFVPLNKVGGAGGVRARAAVSPSHPFLSLLHLRTRAHVRVHCHRRPFSGWARTSRTSAEPP
jgi:hypothetical protein